MTTFPVLSQCQDGVQFKDDTNEDTQALENTVEKLNTHNRTMFNGKKDSKGWTRDCRCHLSPMHDVNRKLNGLLVKLESNFTSDLSKV